jgi:8-oxo-dGTP pyrophosphatase MutT (NUDIX family)
MEGLNVDKIENKEQLPVIETVRAVLFYREKFLLLQKTADSKNPGALEFPGGKIDEIKEKDSTTEEQMNAITKEVQEETGLTIENLPMEKIESFESYFEVRGKDGAILKFKRITHLYLIRLPDSEEVNLKINETKNEKGESEDNHEDYKWVSPDELVNSAISFEENPNTKKQFHPLSRNSRYIKKLLLTTGYLRNPY